MFFTLVVLTLKTTAQDLPKGFVYVDELIPNIALDLRYTSFNNFVGQPIEGYQKARCILSLKATEALKKAQISLNKKDLGLLIYDSYRPQQAVNHFMRWAKNTNDTLMKQHYYPGVKKKNLFKEQYIATRSGHSRGSTIDVTLINLKTGIVLDMGSPFDFFGPESWVSNRNLTAIQIANRQLLQSTMKQFNFRNYPKEWWHFTLCWEPFPKTYFDFPVN
ncbi:MAG: peptidase M15 [Flavobacteriaceae bacterium]|nr:MAG: peptidase M15 [Flavobacteriaceae bacterium]